MHSRLILSKYQSHFKKESFLLKNPRNRIKITLTNIIFKNYVLNLWMYPLNGSIYVYCFVGLVIDRRKCRCCKKNRENFMA